MHTAVANTLRQLGRVSQLTVSTEELIEKARRRDPAALAALYERFHDISKAIAHHHLGNHPEVEDIVQSVWLRVFTCLNQFRGTGQFSTWLYTIVLNECRGFHRWTRRSRTISLENEIHAGRWNNPRASIDPFRIDYSLERDDVSLRTLAGLEKLPKMYRQVLSMRYVAGLSLDQTAAALKISKAAAKSRIMRGHKELKAKVQELILARKTQQSKRPLRPLHSTAQRVQKPWA